jgi:integrase/recombinase XerD
MTAIMRNSAVSVAITPQLSEEDAKLITVWVHSKKNRSAGTAFLYDLTIRQFFGLINKEIRSVSVQDLLVYEDFLQKYRPATRSQRISTVKSMLTFAHKVGYIAINPGAVVKPEMWKETLTARILTEEQVMRIVLSASDNPKEALLIRMIYRTGGRVSEIAGIAWEDVIDAGDHGQVTLFGKGRKTRHIKIPKGLYQEMQSLRCQTGNNDSVFGLNRQQIWRIVRRLAKKAGINEPVSPHWFRHAHATHALSGGAPLHLLCESLGHNSITTTQKYLHTRPGQSSGDFLKIG